MRKLFHLSPLFLVLGASSLFGSSLKSRAVYDFSKGVDTYHSSLSLPDGYVADSQDVLFDATAPISKRNGFTVAFTTGSYAYQAAWTYTDSTNTSWLIVRSSAQIMASNLAGSVVLIATTSANDLVGETNSQGNAYFVDPTQGVYYWNGTATTYVSGSPHGSLIASFHGRLWVAGAAAPNGNQLYGSKYLDGTSWTPSINPNDPVQLTVGLQDNFDNITALYPFLDTLYTFKHYSTYALYGFDQTSFQISFITAECGCIDQASIQTFNHGLDFVSERGVEFFDGYTCTRISDAVKNKIDQAIQSQGGFNSQSWLQSQTPDWLAGNFSTTLSTSIIVPSLVLSSFSATDSSESDFSNGVGSNITFGAGNLMISTDAVEINNNSFEGGFSNWTQSGWNLNPLSTTHCGLQPPPSGGGSFYAYSTTGVSGDLEADVITTSGSIGISQLIFPYADSSCSWQVHIMPSVGSGVNVKLRFIQLNGGGTLTSDPFITNGNIISFQTFSDCKDASCLTKVFGLDLIGSAPRSDITSASYTSRVFDTGVTSPEVVALANWETNSFTPYIEIQNSPSSLGPFTQAIVSSGTSGLASRYVRYISSFTLSSTDSALSTLDDVTITASASSGTFKSQIHNAGAMSSFGNFSVQDILNGGNISFSICSSTNSDMSAPNNCANQPINTQIAVATGPYVQVYATYTVTAGTQNPILNSFTVGWFSAGRTPSMASMVWDNRYWLSLSTNTADFFNDAILVFNSKGAISPFNITAGGLTQYKNNLYIADSQPTGNVNLYGQGYNDNGNPINAFIVTKDYPEDGLSSDDYYDSLYVSEDNLGNYNTQIQFVMDRDKANPFMLSNVNQSEFASNAGIKIPFVLDNQNFGKTITFKFIENDLGSPWNFYGWTAYFHPRNPQ